MKEKVIVFGRGGYYKKKEENLKKRHEIAAFLDNSVDKESYDEIAGCPVYPASSAANIPFKDTPIICMSAQFVDMWRQLIGLGIDEKRIRFASEIRPVLHSERALFSEGGRLEASGGVIKYIAKDGQIYEIRDTDDERKIKKSVFKTTHPEIKNIQFFNNAPASNIFGCEYGKAVDRYYIENFLSGNRDLISGEVMEIASADYIRRFGRNIQKEIILHVNGGNGTHKGNFETGEGITEGMADCLICTQTLQYIYNLSAAVRNIYMLLKAGGAVLCTLPGIKSLSPGDSAAFGEYWSFTAQSAKRLFGDVFGDENVKVESYGNVKVTMAYLYGVALEDMEISDMEYNDPQFPFLITVSAIKT